MSTEEVLIRVMKEVMRAEEFHPNWPTDLVRASMVIAEESGELIQSVNDYEEQKSGKERIIIEAIHTAATALRFLKNID